MVNGINLFYKLSAGELSALHSDFVTMRNESSTEKVSLKFTDFLIQYKKVYGGSIALVKMELDYLYECAVRFANATNVLVSNVGQEALINAAEPLKAVMSELDGETTDYSVGD